MPTARPDEDLLAVERERRLERLHDPIGDVGGRHAVAAVLEEDRELVPAEARGRVGRTQATAEPVADLAQQLVAGRVAE